MIWSPFSNLLLYGETARVEAARAAGMPIGLGPDWSPSGSKSLLGELKVAWLYNQQVLNGLFKTRELVAMATRTAAHILKWHGALGSLEAGKRADILVIDGTAQDAYDTLVRAKDTSIRLVIINGIARYGSPDLMGKLAPRDQTVRVGGETRRLFLDQETGDPDVKAVSLSTATSRLRAALRDIKKLAQELERPKRGALRAKRALDVVERPVWSLALDEIQDTGVDLRPRLPFRGPRDFTGPESGLSGAPLLRPQRHSRRSLSRSGSIRSRWRTTTISWPGWRLSRTCRNPSGKGSPRCTDNSRFGGCGRGWNERDWCHRRVSPGKVDRLGQG